MSPTDTVEADAPEQVAEFPSDEHRASHVAALVQEKKGYVAKIRGAEEVGDDVAKRRYESRAKQVQDELDRLAGEATKPSQRAARR